MAPEHIQRLQCWCEARGLPKRWVYRVAPAIFWVGIIFPSHTVMWRWVLPVVGKSSALTPAFLTCEVCHLIMWVITSRADPGVLKFTPQQSEQLVAASKQRVQLCPHTGVAMVCRSKYVPYINEIVGRFDHYCDWLHNAIGARNHGYYLLLMVFQTFAVRAHSLRWQLPLFYQCQQRRHPTLPTSYIYCMAVPSNAMQALSGVRSLPQRGFIDRLLVAVCTCSCG